MSANLFSYKRLVHQDSTAKRSEIGLGAIRRPIAVACVLALVLLALSGGAQAQWNFVTNNGAIMITGYTGSEGDVTIPSTTNGLAVCSINNNAFMYCARLTNVTISSGVTNMGGGTFLGCSNLVSVTIPIGVTYVGMNTFARCSSLTKVTLPVGVTAIAPSAFEYCSSLPGIAIPYTVTNIGDHVFNQCNSLTAIEVDGSNSVYSSVDGVLFNKKGTSLLQYPGGKAGGYVIPSTVTNVGPYAFYNCTNLATITIPDSVTSIGAVFYYCIGLTAIMVDENNALYSSLDGVLFDKGRTSLIQYPAGKLGSYTIPSTVTNVGPYSFYHCSGLASVMIPGSVTSIGSAAFFWCIQATNVTLSSGIGSIGDHAFYHCISLTNVTIPITVTNIGTLAFGSCGSLVGVYFLGSAPEIDSSSFSGESSASGYYMLGTGVWPSTFGGLPTVLWNPQVQMDDGGFGVRTNQFGFNLTSANNLIVVVEACANLANPVWQPVGTNILSGGSSHFSDPSWTIYPARFYRLRTP